MSIPQIFKQCLVGGYNMQELITSIIQNPLYLILFGSGGILVVIVAIIALGKNGKDKGGINIGINIAQEQKPPRAQAENSGKDYNLDIEDFPEVDKLEEYQHFGYNTDEYYITFLKTIEEKKKAGDDITYD